MFVKKVMSRCLRSMGALCFALQLRGLYQKHTAPKGAGILWDWISYKDVVPMKPVWFIRFMMKYYRLNCT